MSDTINTEHEKCHNLLHLTPTTNTNNYMFKPLKLIVNNLYMYVIDSNITIFVYEENNNRFALPYSPNPLRHLLFNIKWRRSKEYRRITDETFEGHKVDILKIAPFKVHYNWSELSFLPFISEKQTGNKYYLMIYQVDNNGNIHELLPREYFIGNMLTYQVNIIEEAYQGKNDCSLPEIYLFDISDNIEKNVGRLVYKYSYFIPSNINRRITSEFYNKIYRKR